MLTICTVVLAISVGSASANNWPIVNVKTDLDLIGICKVNAKGNGKTDDTQAIQSAIDYVKANGGGCVYIPAGVYQIKNIKVYDNVTLSGISQEKTIFRGIDSLHAMIELRGGAIMNLTIYGTPTRSVSGNDWKVGTGGVGKGGTAKPAHLIGVIDAKDVLIYNVKALESRYDCLYIRTCNDLKVVNCHFDRAGRNVVSIVGNSDGFVFSNCYIGSLWGLYHFDIEPNKDKYARNGVFQNCTFDGSKAGQMDTDTWGSFVCFSGHPKLENRNIAVIGCTFKNIYVRVRGVFCNVKFIGNTFDGDHVFVKIRTNPVGEFRNTIVRENKFLTGGKPTSRIISGVTFTGTSAFELNTPAKFNNIQTTTLGKSNKWVEDHPVAAYNDLKKLEPGTVTVQGDVKIVSMPLYGHEFRFADAKILKRSVIAGLSSDSTERGDITLHFDPITARGNAEIARFGKGVLESYLDKPLENISWHKKIFTPQAGEVYVIKTRDGKIVLFEIITFKKKYIQFRCCPGQSNLDVRRKKAAILIGS